MASTFSAFRFCFLLRSSEVILQTSGEVHHEKVRLQLASLRCWLHYYVIGCLFVLFDSGCPVAKGRRGGRRGGFGSPGSKHMISIHS